ncbi:unnamed protein product, partial [Mesorhabditis belari]|uniref:Peroxidase n=1 Tax=Mesorhabditis belari TaxID=2138241 RepID=A0AAF3FHT3_9BILA
MRILLPILVYFTCIICVESTSFPCGPSFTPCPGRKARGAITNSILDDLRSNSDISVPLRSLEFDLDNEGDEEERPFVIENRLGQSLLRFSFPSEISKFFSYSALISQVASQKLASKGATLDQIENSDLKGTTLEKICPLKAIEECKLGKYRTYSGVCNNVERPLWGSINQQMQRLLKADYDDGIAAPRGSTQNDRLPSPLLISDLFSSPQNVHVSCSIWVSVWSLFILDDLSLPSIPFLSQGAQKSYFKGESPIPLPCCSNDETLHPECFPILGNDGECLPYSRSMLSPHSNCSLGSREQMNEVTSFIDGSNIYGSNVDTVNKLRTLKDGKLSLITSLTSPIGFPPNSEGQSPCSSSVQHCFQSGHPRSNQFPSTSALYILWMRQHNNIARELKEVNKHWNDERIFEETRKIIIAQIQHITYSEMLPMLIGKETLRRDGLSLRNRGFDSNYDMEVNPNALNEFVSVLSGFFYSLHPPTIQYLDENDSVLREDPLRKVFMDPSQLVNRGRFEAIMRFLSRRQMNRPGLTMAEDLRKRFLGVEGFDLASWIIQMGRDHGIPSYNKWRHSCGLIVPKDWREFGEIIGDEKKVEEFEKIYRSIDDVDLFVGGMAEIAIKGALLGPTFSCILSRQFHNTRVGDRFWYENFFTPTSFTQEQLEEIRKTTLARIICENTDSSLHSLQPHLFVVPDLWGNCEVECNSTVIPKVNLKVWIDEEPQPKLPITQKTLEKAIRLGFEQFERLEREEKSRIDRLNVNLERDSSLVSHSLLMSPKKESIDISRKASILSQATRILLDGTELDPTERLPSDLSLKTLQKLLPSIDVATIIGNFTPFLGRENRKREECLPEPLPCDHTYKYRTYSGWCNNLKFPKYGNAFGPMRRLLDPAYDDGFDHPRTLSKTGRPLPSARKISNHVHADSPKFHVKFTHMLMQFGQILDHDMMHSPIARGPNNTILNCSACDSFEKVSVHCFPIRIDPGDPFFPATHSNGKPRCMPFARSLLAQLTLGYRNQLNQLTSFLDASTIYGSTECEANRLRLFSRGLLNFTNLGFNKEALPQGPQERDCRSILTDSKARCFEAGDERVNEQPGLAALHTIFLREHNRLATELRKLNNFWNDEQLYQETRRIMIAKLQHIIFSEWLPVVVGCDTMSRYDLMPKKTGYYTEYDPHCDASITQEMSTSAFRFGHTLIRAVFPRMNAAFGNETEPVLLKDHFSNPLPLYNKSVGHMESLLMGLVGSESMAFDASITDAVRNHLFAKPGGPLTGIDLPAVNIQRGRDHGVKEYNAYREMCGFPKARHFSDLKDTMDNEAIKALEKAYENVDDIDLFPGLMSERPLKGALVGPMLGCIIAEQMQRLKKCDRFYYENDQSNTKFTIGQLAEIRKSSLSGMICRNSNWAAQMQPNVFLMPDELTNAPIGCSEVPEIDLTEWIDRQWCVIGDRVIGRGKTAKATPCVTCTCTSDGPECHPIQIENCETLLNFYSLEDIQADTSCAIQCSSLLKRHTEEL